jgi:hypothetical protein
MKRIALMLAVAALAAAATGAAVATAARTATDSKLCTVARGVARDIVASTSVSRGTVNPASIRTTYEKIAGAEPAVLAAASTPQKTDLKPVFAFVNLVIADFRKVNWNPAGIAPYASTLLVRAQAVQGHIHRLQVYFRTVCKLPM